MTTPLLSICIPSYNRPLELKRLLDSIYVQNTQGIEVVVAEDVSPKREDIKHTVETYKIERPEFNLNLHLNQKNLGYDGNLRGLLSLATGNFCLFMGDDDILCPGAIQKVMEVLNAYPEIGMALRDWEEVDLNENLLSTSKYYSSDKIFEPSLDTVAEFFRKSIFISGLIFHRETSLKYNTDRFDGILLYQIYLLSQVLQERKGFYIAQTIAQRIRGAEHYFGSAGAEKGLFEPKVLKPEHSLNFMQGFIKILDSIGNYTLKKKVLKDFSNKAFGYLSLQRGNGINSFIKYTFKLNKMGFAKTLPFWIYFIMLLVLGEKISEKLILNIKKIHQ